jgi:hypothetical protein
MDTGPYPTKGTRVWSITNGGEIHVVVMVEVGLKGIPVVA